MTSHQSNDDESFKALLDASRGQENWEGERGTRLADDQGRPRSGFQGTRQDHDDGFGEFEGSDMPFTVGDLVGGTTPRGGAGGGHVTSSMVRDVEPVGEGTGRRGGQGAATMETAELGTVKEDHSVHSRFSIKRYRGFFDVNTSDVTERIWRSLLFWKCDFVDSLESNPDLYGPFWIASTLVFVSAAAANTAGYIAHRQAHGSGTDYWYYDVDKVGGSMAMFYGYIGVVGMGVWAVVRYLAAKEGAAGTTAGSAPSLATVWCVYGYALSVFVPVSVACVVPNDVVRWVLVMTATVVSGLFLLQSFVGAVGSHAVVGRVPVLAGVGACHLGLGLALKFVFFDY